MTHMRQQFVSTIGFWTLRESWTLMLTLWWTLPDETEAHPNYQRRVVFIELYTEMVEVTPAHYSALTPQIPVPLVKVGGRTRQTHHLTRRSGMIFLMTRQSQITLVILTLQDVESMRNVADIALESRV